MFGYHPGRERELRKNGVRAFATALDVKRTHELKTQGDPSLVSSTQRLWKLRLNVAPDDGAPFEATVDAWFGQLSEPTVGGQFAVLFHPDDHTKLIIDQSDQAESALTDAQTKERTEETVAKMRARGQNEIADRYQTVFDSGLKTNWSSDPVELRAQIRERKEKMRNIMAGDGPGAQQRVAAEAMARYAEQYQRQASSVVSPPTSAVSDQPAHPTDDAAATADALTKLSDLRDRGVLTDEEFQGQKKKLLGE